MLELQRYGESHAHRQRLQGQLGEPTLFQAMTEALAFLRTRIAPSLVTRVQERLMKALPDEDAHRLRLPTGEADTAVGR